MLYIDSDRELSGQVDRFCRAKGLSVTFASSLAEAAGYLERRNYEIVIADMPTMGARLREFLGSLPPRGAAPAVILLCPREQRETAVAAAIEGAADYLLKPFSLAELDFRVGKTRELLRLGNERQVLRGDRHFIHRPENLIGKSPAVLRMIEMVNKIAPTDSSVVLVGETGTGKELIAAAIHYSSPRSGGAFVKVNCATLPDSLLESELFGHEKGAFTGAEKLRIGRFEQADGGTLFLDEIADVSPMVQAKLLRALQEQQFERLGSNRTIEVDVRIVTATSKHLDLEMREGRFRPDLYYRLNVVTVSIPPLRERGGDVELLARHFVRRYATDLKKTVTDVDPAAMKILTEHSWPGNIRELKNVIERAVIMTDTERIRPEDMRLAFVRKPAEASHSTIMLPTEGVHWKDMERDLLLQALERCSWVQKDAARLLGLSTRVLNYKVHSFGITHPKWRQYR